MKKIILSFLFLLVGVPSWACSCISQPERITIKDYISEDFIFTGRVTKVINNFQEKNYKRKAIYLQVNKVFRGDISTDTVVVYSPLGDASCGLYVKEGDEWIIWANWTHGVISTNQCSRSQMTEMLTKYNLEMLHYFTSNPDTKEWFDIKGIKIAEGQLINKNPHGNWKLFFEDGLLEQEGVYLNGKAEGKWIEYYHPSVVMRNMLPRNKPVVLDSLEIKQAYQRPKFITYYKNGLKDGEITHDYLYEKVTFLYKNGELKKSIYYFRHGTVKFTLEHQGGSRHGWETEYHPNGKVKLTGMWENNERKGEYREYNEMGKLIKRTFYK